MKKVTMYSTPTCHFCHIAKDFFNKNDVAFEEHDVSSDVEKRTEMMDLSDQMGVPVIHIGTDVIVGFNEPMIRELLDIK
ncbi:NrdH-redoxin [Candidatus Wolfebacteria bacterium]|nr:MAG: NrdH-redoxin [Candidatus Wolfebacteria bacterium]